VIKSFYNVTSTAHATALNEILCDCYEGVLGGVRDLFQGTNLLFVQIDGGKP
jgi:hypothetical protein